jgi:glucose-6-phosphate-specific signal transduction histidine kinase
MSRDLCDEVGDPSTAMRAGTQIVARAIERLA